MRRSLRGRILRFFLARLAAIGQFIARSRPFQWVVGLRSVRFVARILVILWQFTVSRIWRPSRRAFHRTRKFLGKREVLPWAITWSICVLLAWAILMPLWMLKFICGLLAGLTFLIIAVRSPLAALVIWVVTSPLMNILIKFKLVEGTPVVTGDRLCLVALFLVYMIQPHIKARFSSEPPKNPHARANLWLHVAMAAYIIIMLLNTLRSARITDAAQGVLDSYFAPMLVYFFAMRWISDHRKLSIVLTALIVVGVYFSLAGIPEHFLGRTLFKATGYVETELNTVRVQGPAETPTEFGMAVALSILLAVLRLAHTPRGGSRILNMVLIGLFGAALALTLRRSVYVALALSLLVMLRTSPKPRKVIIVMLTSVALGFIIFWGPFSSSKVYTARVADQGPVYSRMGSAMTAWSIIRHNPIFGVGYGNIVNYRSSYDVPLGVVPYQYRRGAATAHNQFLSTLAEGGIVTFIPLLGMVVMMGVITLRIWKQTEGQPLIRRDEAIVLIGLYAAYVLQLVQGDAFRHGHYMTSTLFLMLGGFYGVYVARQAPIPQEADGSGTAAPSRFQRRSANGRTASRRLHPGFARSRAQNT